MMSSRYPILDNRPIDQWKVIELKEELKRRKLATKGLKDDLIKRLDEAIRIEREAAEKDEANGFDPDPHPVVGVEDSEAVTATAEIVNKIVAESPLTVETAAKGDFIVEPIEGDYAGKIPEVLGGGSNKNDKLDGVTALIDIDNSVPTLGEVSHKDLPASIDSARVGEEIAHGSIMETNITVTEGVVTEVVVSGQDSHSMGTQKENGKSATKRENEESKAWLEDEDSKPQLDQDIDLSCKGAMPHSSAPVNQVSEVNPNLGSQVKSKSISIDSVSINEKIELKDNILADNVKLEQDIVRPEMVEPSSSNSVSVFDESHSMNGEELHEKKSSVEQNRNDVTSPDLNKTNSSEDGGYPEKLNLDRSSGDDSMEDDLPESKQFNLKFNADEPREKRKSCEVPIVKDDSITKVLGDGLSARISDTLDDTGIHSAEKRKFLDQASVGNNEPAKRQRRWNSETVKVADPQSTNLPPAARHKDEPVALKPNFSSSDLLTSDDAARERIVPTPQRSPTNSLRIDHFLRPFTLKAVQELLGKTGNVTSFWMDHIKTHCYVTYSSVEEAIGTRNAVYNLQWPSNGGRLLVAEFVDPQEVKMKLEPPPVQAVSVSSGPAVPPVHPTSEPEPSPRQNRELPPVPATLPLPPPLPKAPLAARERLPLPPPLPEKVDPPIVTLDDLFRKTSATPRIYYLPLSEEQVAAKLAAHGKSSKQ